MPRVAPEVVRGARGERGPETVTMIPDPQDHPQVAGRRLKPEQVHFVSRYREYTIVVSTEADHVTATGQIVKGRNRTVRFKDFNFITDDAMVIEKIRGIGRGFGLGREVWEKWMQDQALAEKSIEIAEAALDGLSPEMQTKLVGRLMAKLESFQLPQRQQTMAIGGDEDEGDEDEQGPDEDEDSNEDEDES